MHWAGTERPPTAGQRFGSSEISSASCLLELGSGVKFRFFALSARCKREATEEVSSGSAGRQQAPRKNHLKAVCYGLKELARLGVGPAGEEYMRKAQIAENCPADTQRRQTSGSAASSSRGPPPCVSKVVACLPDYGRLASAPATEHKDVNSRLADSEDANQAGDFLSTALPS